MCEDGLPCHCPHHPLLGPGVCGGPHGAGEPLRDRGHFSLQATPHAHQLPDPISGRVRLPAGGSGHVPWHDQCGRDLLVLWGHVMQAIYQLRCLAVYCFYIEPVLYIH